MKWVYKIIFDSRLPAYQRTLIPAVSLGLSLLTAPAVYPQMQTNDPFDTPDISRSAVIDVSPSQVYRRIYQASRNVDFTPNLPKQARVAMLISNADDPAKLNQAKSHVTQLHMSMGRLNERNTDQFNDVLKRSEIRLLLIIIDPHAPELSALRYATEENLRKSEEKWPKGFIDDVLILKPQTDDMDDRRLVKGIAQRYLKRTVDELFEKHPELTVMVHQEEVMVSGAWVDVDMARLHWIGIDKGFNFTPQKPLPGLETQPDSSTDAIKDKDKPEDKIAINHIQENRPAPADDPIQRDTESSTTVDLSNHEPGTKIKTQAEEQNAPARITVTSEPSTPVNSMANQPARVLGNQDNSGKDSQSIENQTRTNTQATVIPPESKSKTPPMNKTPEKTSPQSSTEVNTLAEAIQPVTHAPAILRPRLGRLHEHELYQDRPVEYPSLMEPAPLIPQTQEQPWLKQWDQSFDQNSENTKEVHTVNHGLNHASHHFVIEDETQQELNRLPGVLTEASAAHEWVDLRHVEYRNGLMED